MATRLCMKKICIILLAALIAVASMLVVLPTTVQAVDANSIEDKVICGYQGWFLCHGDNSPFNGWTHWSNGAYQSSSGIPSPGYQQFELFPDTSQYPSASLFNTGYGSLGNGSAPTLFSSYKSETVNLHFQWMQEYGIDGVALQRFGTEIGSSSFLDVRNSIASKVRQAAETYGRIFYIMYDISGMNSSTWKQQIQDDWTNVINSQLNITGSSQYAKQNDKVVVGIWGMGFTDRPGTAQECEQLISWFKNTQNCYVIGGVPLHWRASNNSSKAGFQNVYKALDMVSPWTVGSYNTDSQVDSYKNNYLIPDRDYCNTYGMKYLPVVFPGFAWSNWNGGSQNMIPRRQGGLMWRQVYNVRSSGIPRAYIAMFDEYDEGTAICKAAEDWSMKPVNQYFLTLSTDGRYLSSDFYLRLADKATRVIKGLDPNTANVPIAETSGPVHFRTSVETGFDATQTWIDTVDITGGRVNVSGYGGIANPECGTVSENVNHRGGYSIRYSGRDSSTSMSYCYFKTFDVNIPVTADTKLSYWIYPQQELGRYVAVDLIMTDGTTLRDCGALDQFGISVHPATPRGTVNTWTQIQSNIGQWLNGKTIDRIMIAYDHAPDTGDFRGYIDDIVITNSSLGF